MAILFSPVLEGLCWMAGTPSIPIGTPGRTFNGGWGWRMSIRPTEPLSIQAWVDTEVVEDAEVDTSLGPRTLQFPVQPPQAVPMFIQDAQFKLTVWA